MLADLAASSKITAAQKLYEQALKRDGDLALRNPEVPDYQADLAGLHMNLGELNARSGGCRRSRVQLWNVLKRLWTILYGSTPACLAIDVTWR